MYKTVKWILLVVGIGFLVFVGYLLYFSLNFSFSFDNGKHFSKQDLIDNYNTRAEQINELKRYVNSIVPVNKSVDIEFDGNKRLFFFHIIDEGNYDSNWELKIRSPKVDTLLNKLGWNHQTLKTLKEKLDAANCVSVKNGEPCNVGFQRSGLGMYFYNIFDKRIPDSLKAKYNDSCTYILYNDKVVLEYGGGAVGPQCFPIR